MEISQMKFSYKIPNISKLDKIFTTDVNLQGVPWNVEIKKNFEQGNESLAIYLNCKNGDKSSEWSYAAKASFSLSSFKENVESYKRTVEPDVFDISNTGWGFNSFIKWNDLLYEENCYVENDAINLCVDIEVADPNDVNKSRLIFEKMYQSCDKNCRTNFQLTIENVSRLMAVKTPSFDDERLPWTLLIRKSLSGNLAVRLQTNDKELDKKNLLIKVVSSIENKDTIKSLRPSSGFRSEKVMSWDELLKPENGFVRNNTIKIFVNVTEKDVHDNGNNTNGAMGTKRATETMECSICLDDIAKKEVSSVHCGHLFCTNCITKHLQKSGICPMCKKPAGVQDLRRIYLPGAIVTKMNETDTSLQRIY